MASISAGPAACDTHSLGERGYHLYPGRRHRLSTGSVERGSAPAGLRPFCARRSGRGRGLPDHALLSTTGSWHTLTGPATEGDGRRFIAPIPCRLCQLPARAARTTCQGQPVDVLLPT